MYIRLERVTGGLVLSGWFSSFKTALEYAYAKNMPLHGLNAAYQDLSHITLEGIDLSGADFTGARLVNANLSHTILTDAIFKDTNINEACLAGSTLPLWFCTKNSNSNKNTTTGYKKSSMFICTHAHRKKPDNKGLFERLMPRDSYTCMTQRKSLKSTRN